MNKYSCLFYIEILFLGFIGPMYWTTHLAGGPRRVNHAAAAVKDEIYCFGGYCNEEDYKEKRNIDVFLLNTKNNRWRKVATEQNIPDIPFQRYGHTVVAFENKIYLWGGRNDNYISNSLYIFDPETKKWSKPNIIGYIPETRDGHSACVINKKMFVFAGFLEISMLYTQDVEILDLQNLQWSRLTISQGQPPCYRDFHTAIGHGGKMYVWGGREAPFGNYLSPELEEYNSDLYVLDPFEQTWTVIAAEGDIPIGRRSHSAVLYKEKMYIFGGFNSKERSHYNDFYQFDIKTNVWSKLLPHGLGPSCRRRHVCCVVSEKMFFFGGTSPRPGYILPEVETEDQIDYGLIDHDDLYVLDMCPSLKTLALIEIVKRKLTPPWLPIDIKFDLKSITLPNKISRPINNTG